MARGAKEPGSDARGPWLPWPPPLATGLETIRGLGVAIRDVC